MITEKDRYDFTKGACYLFADVISQETGWDVVCFFDDTFRFMAKHVFVRTPDGYYLDIEGKHGAGEMMERWECMNHLYSIRNITAKDRARCSLPMKMGDEEQYRLRAKELAREVIAMGNMKLVRDENGEPVRELHNRDRWGRFCRPYYAYTWE
jgi:hypothetical protein